MEEKKLTVSIRRDIEARVADSTTVNLYTYREDKAYVDRILEDRAKELVEKVSQGKNE